MVESSAQAVVLVSAKTGEGIGELLELIKTGVQEAAELNLILPQEKASSISQKAKFFGNVVRVKETAAEDGKVHLVFLGPEWAIDELRQENAAAS
jgi:50S ribosomal subunit-associated GTPase HflX